jgi:ATP-binding cassette subfamily C (CFTR/MRP) protein 1
LVLAAMLGQGTKVLNDWWLSAWTVHRFDVSLQTYAGVYGGMGVAQVSFVATMAVLVAFISTTAARNLHERAFRSLMRAPMHFFDTTPIGRILSRFSRDQDTIDAALGDTFRMNCMLGSMAFFTCVIISVSNPWFLLPFAPVALTYYRTQVNNFSSRNNKILLELQVGYCRIFFYLLLSFVFV